MERQFCVERSLVSVSIRLELHSPMTHPEEREGDESSV